MKRQPLSFKNRVSLILLIAVFGLCTFLVASRQAETSDGEVVLRVSHLFNDPATEAAIEAIGQEYSRLHPEVIVKFQKVPQNIFLQWFRTQMISDEPPGIIQYQLWHRGLRQMVAQNFAPLNDLVEQPNPYNKETSLDGVPLRETYVDGLQGGESFFPEMGAYFGLPYRGITLRVMYNRDLMKEIMGDPDWTPQNWREFIALCEKTEDYARSNDLQLFPIAADKFGIYLMGNEAVLGVSQKLALRTNYDFDFTMTEAALSSTLRFIRGEWDLRSPEIQAGFKIYREVSRHLQPGFLQFSGSDVSFQFLQGHALMTVVGGPSFSSQASFSLGAFRIPGLARDNAEYGANALGPYSEAKHASSHAFGIPRKTQHKEVARDFLQFLTSQRINQEFTDKSGEVPVIRDVQATPLATKFLPQMDGYLYGILPRNLGGVSTRQVFSENIHRLFQAKDGVEALVSALEENDIMKVAIHDTRAHTRNYQSNLRETDATLTAQFFQSDQSTKALGRHILRQTMFERDFLRMAYTLDQVTE